MAVSVFRIEYEILPSMNPWTAFVGAFTHEEAQRHLQKVVGKPIRIVSSGLASRLDDISNEVRQNIINAAFPAKTITDNISIDEKKTTKVKK